jgi:hypothetical protein
MSVTDPLVAPALSQPGHGTAEPVGGEDQALAGDDRRRGGGGPPVIPAGRAGPPQVADAGLDGEPGRRIARRW